MREREKLGNKMIKDHHFDVTIAHTSLLLSSQTTKQNKIKIGSEKLKFDI